MKILIETAGDRSVGIQPDRITIDWPSLEVGDDSGRREALRKDIQETFTNFLDERCGVRFDDECPDCGKVMFVAASGRSGPHRTCNNPTCIRNIPDETA
jgi:hypothetical protein